MTRRIALVLALWSGIAGSAWAGERRQIEESFDWARGQRLLVEFPVGELRIEGDTGERVRVEVDARCRWGNRRCEERLQELRVRSRSSDRRLWLEIDSAGPLSRANLELKAVIRMPRTADLDVEMGVGELEVSGLDSDVRLDLGVGEVRLWHPAAAVRSVSLDVGVGESRLDGAGRPVRERRSLLIGSELYWDEGEGGGQLIVEVGVGEVSVYLE